MAKVLTKEQQEKMANGLPKDWNRWTYRRVVRVRMKNAFYFKGQILRIKYFVTFGAFDYKGRWVDYYDVGPEIQLTFWRKLWFNVTKWL